MKFNDIIKPAESENLNESIQPVPAGDLDIGGHWKTVVGDRYGDRFYKSFDTPRGAISFLFKELRDGIYTINKFYDGVKQGDGKVVVMENGLRRVAKSYQALHPNLTLPEKFSSKEYGDLVINQNPVYADQIDVAKEKTGEDYEAYVTKDRTYGYTPHSTNAMVGTLVSLNGQGNVQDVEFDSVTVDGQELQPPVSFTVVSGMVDAVVVNN